MVSEIRSRLIRVFPQEQADLLVEVFVDSHADFVIRADFQKLTEVVRDLADAQKRTEIHVEELAEAQKRTEIHLDELAMAQQEMARSQQEMAKAQQEFSRTQQGMQGALEEMQRAMADLAKQVGGLSNAVGANLEDFACDIIPELLEKYWQFATMSAGPEELTTAEGVGREFDVVVRGTIDGHPVTVLCETKATVTTTEVSKFLRIIEKMRGARPGEDIRPMFFGYKANSAARELIVKSGAAMIFTRGVMIPAAA
jgi:hypothetical protein